MSTDKAAQTEKPDEGHLAWAIDQRAEIQRTLLVLYGFVRHSSPDSLDHDTRYLLDLLIGAAFSLWRAVFLAETFRDVVQVHQSQEAFLLKVITDNAITFADDKATDAGPWNTTWRTRSFGWREPSATPTPTRV